jgi:hypothetical protein
VIGAPAPAAPGRDPVDEARAWLSTTCTTGEEPGLPPVVIEGAARVEPYLQEALEGGPDEAAMRQFEESAIRRLRARAALLAREVPVGLSAEDLEAARRRGEAELLERARQDYSQRYRSRAAAALDVLAAVVAAESGG